MIHSLYIFNHTGEVLIEKHWRGAVSRSVADFFWEEVNKLDNREDIAPILNTAKFYLFNIYRNNLFFMCTTTNEVAPLWGVEFLHRVYDIFEEYFSVVDESTLKENFSTVYQLLEEMLDHGYAMTTEPNSLKMMIPPPTMLGKIQSAVGGSSISDVLPDGTISSMPWRKAGVRYTQNEIYFDVEEEINAIVDNTGSMVSVSSSNPLCKAHRPHVHTSLRYSGVMRGERKNQVQLSTFWRPRSQPYFCGSERH